MISKHTSSASESCSIDSDEDGGDNSANKVSHFIGMRQFF